MKKPIPIDLTRHAHLVEGSKEFLRMWMRDDGPVTCFINPAALAPDPFAFGIALVDAVRNGARAWARAVNISEAEAEARIWEGLDAERGQATDRPRDPPAETPDPEDDFISYTGKPH
ncbi:DUF5076 domain-containing protein [Sphingomonas bacterium]|uniref:DUF5076 domain-containing protein n=1 Tax=Sphingomonas bacterium TaxID=1895847 RepID=UPI0020C70A30|nr:DUF5076 domain-containing protein [Sphingomonas bacterium]